MLNIIKQVEEAKQSEKDQPRELKTLYVCPAPPEKPDDGILNYAALATIYDLDKLPAFTVCLIDEKSLDILRCVNAYRTVFGVELLFLIGLPQAEYSPTFDSIVWDLERVSYDGLVSELALARETREMLEAQGASEHDRERATYVRKTGQVKEHQALVLKDAESVRDSDDDPENELDDEVP